MHLGLYDVAVAATRDGIVHCFGFADVELQCIALVECNSELLYFGQDDSLSVFQREIYVVIILCDVLEYRIAAVGPVLAILAGSFAQICPRRTAVGRNVPVTVLDFQLRGDAVLAIGARPAVRSVCAVLTIFTVSARLAVDTVFTVSTRLAVDTVFTVLTVAPLCLDLLAGCIEQPVAVQRPIIYPVGVLTNADNRCKAVIAVTTVCTILPVLPVINRNGRTLGKGNRVADGLAIIGNRGNAGHIVVVL